MPRPDRPDGDPGSLQQLFSTGSAHRFLTDPLILTVLMDKSLIGDCYTWQSLHHSGLSLTEQQRTEISERIYIGDPSFHGVGVRNSVFRDLLKDVLTGKMLAGCALMFAAVLLSEPCRRKIAAVKSI